MEARTRIWVAVMALFALAGSAAEAADFKGDVRLRTEAIQREDSAPSSYWQQRLMFRLGSKFDVNPTSDVEFRVASGTGRTTTNQTFGQSGSSTSTPSGFLNQSIGIDRAFFRWHGYEGANVYGGRIRNYFYIPGGSDLIWDSDLNFDGVGATYEYGMGSITPFVNLGFFWVSKNPAGQDNKLGAAQIGIKQKSDALEWAVSGGTYAYTKFAGQTALTGGDGNTFVAPATATGSATYANDYRLLTAGADVAAQTGFAPVGLAVDFVKNAAVSSEATGFLVGARLGSLKKAGEWMLAYDYRQLQQDAAVSAFTDADTFLNGGTDGRGHRFKAGYVIDTGFTVGAQYYMGKKFIADGETSVKRNKAQLDLIFAF